MPDVTIRDIPDSTLRGLERKAAQREQSLEEYVLDLLIREVTGPTFGGAIPKRAAQTAKRGLRLTGASTLCQDPGPRPQS
jgi:plasmid stability protein